MCPRCRMRPPWKRPSCPTRRRSRRRFGSSPLTSHGNDDPSGHAAAGRVGPRRDYFPLACEAWRQGDGVRAAAGGRHGQGERRGPLAGQRILREIIAKEGETVQAGAEIAVVEVGADGEKAAAPVPAPASVAAAPAPEVKAAPQPAPTAARAPAPAPVLDGGEHRYSPAVQMQASELGVDLSKVEGTGIGGRVTKKVVEQFTATTKTAAAT